MKLTPAQVAAVAAGAGFTGEALVRAVAVALAESGGDTRAVNVNSDSRRTRDRGLWQINSYWHREVTDAQAFDPNAAARAAYRISNGGRDWSQWSTWKNGAAAAQLGRARFAVAALGKGGKGGASPVVDLPLPDWIDGLPEALTGGEGSDLPLPDVLDGTAEHLLSGNIGAPLDALRTLVVAVGKTGAWIADPHNWTRVALVAGGTVGVLLALRMIAESGAAGSTAAQVAAIPGNLTKKAAAAAGTVATGGTGAAVRAVA